MSWAAAVAGGAAVLGYMTAQQQMAAQRQANSQNAALSREATAENRRQFNLQAGEMAESRREREDEINEQMQARFDAARTENIGRLDPYAQAGAGAVQEQQALMGLSGVPAQNEAMARFTESPGQKFLRERQERALLRSSAAIGGLGGGNVRTALQEQAFGLASTRLDDRLNRLQGLAGQGLSTEQTITGMGYGPGYIQTGVDTGVASEESLADEEETTTGTSSNNMPGVTVRRQAGTSGLGRQQERQGGRDRSGETVGSGNRGRSGQGRIGSGMQY